MEAKRNSRRQETARRIYAESALVRHNRGQRDRAKARRLGADLNALRASQPDGPGFAARDRVCTLRDLVAHDPKIDHLCGIGDSHLLVPDIFNTGFYLPKALYDYQAEPTNGDSDQYLCDVHEGSVLLPADTLIYWK